MSIVKTCVITVLYVASLSITCVIDIITSRLRLSSGFFFFSSRRRHTRYWRDWSSDVCSSDLPVLRRRGHKEPGGGYDLRRRGRCTIRPVLPPGLRRHKQPEPHGPQPVVRRGEIGRASCRERV